ncbi:MAG TPA: hypothetical protein VIK18_07270, partial [Pirellulales bacterium]
MSVALGVVACELVAAPTQAGSLLVSMLSAAPRSAIVPLVVNAAPDEIVSVPTPSSPTPPVVTSAASVKGAVPLLTLTPVL